MSDTHKFLPYCELLSEEQIRSISGAAARLYSQAWNRMAYRDLTSVVVSNKDATERGRFQLYELQPAQRELVRNGLMDVTIDSDDRATYRFMEDPTH